MYTLAVGGVVGRILGGGILGGAGAAAAAAAARGLGDTATAPP